MYMVVETGGKQVKVSEGDVLTVERIEGSLGDSIKLENVKLFVDGDVVVADKNSLSGSLANAVIENHGRPPQRRACYQMTTTDESSMA